MGRSSSIDLGAGLPQECPRGLTVVSGPSARPFRTIPLLKGLCGDETEWTMFCARLLVLECKNYLHSPQVVSIYRTIEEAGFCDTF